MFVIPN